MWCRRSRERERNPTAGRDAEHRIVDKRTAEEETASLLLFAGKEVAALRCAGAVHRSPDCRHRLFRGLAGTVQLLRAYRLQSFCSDIPLGKQPAGLFRRARGQLCLL